MQGSSRHGAYVTTQVPHLHVPVALHAAVRESVPNRWMEQQGQRPQEGTALGKSKETLLVKQEHSWAPLLDILIQQVQGRL